MRASIRVKPGAAHVRVGGVYPVAGQQNSLIIAVTAPAVDGRANAAALDALADALQVKSSQLAIVSGAHARTKIVEFPDDYAGRWLALLG